MTGNNEVAPLLGAAEFVLPISRDVDETMAPCILTKVGDYVYTDSQAYEPTEPYGKCKYCNNLSTPSTEQGNGFRGATVAVADLISGERVEECLWCKVLASCIQAFEPKAQEMAEYSPQTGINVYISGTNVVALRTRSRDGFVVQERSAFQLYRMPGTGQLPDGLQVPTCPELATEPGQDSMWDYLRQCLMTCLYSHDECRSAQNIGWLPRRLLFVENTGGPISNLRVVSTDDVQGQAPYIALSHCWGTEQPFQLLNSNASDLHRRIEYMDLSRVFQDTLTTAQKFGINYVWIDSLCIIQDDSADVDLQVAQMDDIYENAIFVVAATASQDGSIPFLGPEAPNTRGKTSKTIEIVANNDETILLRARSMNSNLSAQSRGPLRFRAWAWQEDALSTRIMHFAQDQVMWRCNSAAGSELMGQLQPRVHSMRRDMLDPGKRVYEWTHLVENFAALQLTKSHDRLPAFAGVARRFQSVAEDEYIAGIWRRQFLVDVCWERPQALSLLTQPISGGEDDGNPSWSWASLHHEVHFNTTSPPSSIDIMFDVKNIDCRPLSSTNPMGRVRDGSSICVAGWAIGALLVMDDWGFAVVRRPDKVAQRVFPDCRLVPIVLPGDAAEDAASFRRAKPDDPVRHPADDKEEGVKQDDLQRKQNAKDTLICGRVVVMLCHHRELLDKDMTGTGRKHAIVMVFAQISDEPELYQRVGLGRGGDDVSSPNHQEAISWIWIEYENWENWDEWFQGAEHREVTVM